MNTHTETTNREELEFPQNKRDSLPIITFIPFQTLYKVGAV